MLLAGNVLVINVAKGQRVIVASIAVIMYSCFLTVKMKYLLVTIILQKATTLEKNVHIRFWIVCCIAFMAWQLPVYKAIQLPLHNGKRCSYHMQLVI